MATGIANVKGSGIGSNLLTTTTDATFINQTYELALSYLSNTPKVNDYVAYVDSDLIKTLYKVTAVDSTKATLAKIGDIGGGGKQLYQHNIVLGTTTTGTKVVITIINDDRNNYTLLSHIKTWLYNNNFSGYNNIYQCSGVVLSDDVFIPYGVSVISNSIKCIYYTTTASQNVETLNDLKADIVIAL